MDWKKFDIKDAPKLTVEVTKAWDDNTTEGRTYTALDKLKHYEWDGYALKSIKLMGEVNTISECKKLIEFLEIHAMCLGSLATPDKPWNDK